MSISRGQSTSGSLQLLEEKDQTQEALFESVKADFEIKRGEDEAD